jgi:xanthine dehydrogenase large subunit
VGEPPLLLPFSVLLALRDAIAAVAPDADIAPPLRAPATPEAILDAVDAMHLYLQTHARQAATPATADSTA